MVQTDCKIAALFPAGITLRSILTLSPEQTRHILELARWGEVGPTCPKCSCSKFYYLKARIRYSCANCGHQYSVTSGTIFANNKVPLSTLVATVAMVAHAAKGVSGLQLCRNLGLQYKVAFVLLHKIREAISVSLESLKLSGTVEIDGAQFGGYTRAQNRVNGKWGKRMHTRHYRNRHVVVIAYQRFGRTIPFIVKKESDAKDSLIAHLEPGTIIVADEGHAWDSMKELFEMLRIQHNFAYSANNACTNNAESFFSMLRRVHRGTHHKISKEHMRAYAAELAWKRDFADLSNDRKVIELLRLTLAAPKSKWKGYWQRSQEPKRPILQEAA